MKLKSIIRCIYLRPKNLIAVNLGKLKTNLVYNGVGNLAIRIFYTIATFLTSILLTRFMGADGYGKYSAVYALVMILVVPVQLGMPILIMRETAQNLVKDNFGLIKGVRRWSFQTTLLLSLIMMVGISTFFILFQGQSIKSSESIWGLLLVPLIGLSALRSGALRGLHKIVLGQLPEFVLMPGFYIVLILTWRVLNNLPLSPLHAIQLRLGATFLSFIIGTMILIKITPKIIQHAQPIYEKKTWRISVSSLALISGMRIINKWVGFLILGLFVSDAEIGVYRIAIQMAMLADIGLELVNPVINPQIAKLFSLHDHLGLQKLAVISAQITFIISAAITAGFIGFGKQFLQFAYGQEFLSAYLPLTILLAGQIVNAVFGSLDPLLNMTGHEHHTARAWVVSTIINIVLIFSLTPFLGISGAAIASALSLVVFNGMLFKVVKYKLGVVSFAFRKPPLLEDS